MKRFVTTAAAKFKEESIVISFSGGNDSTVTADLVTKALSNPSLVHIFAIRRLSFRRLLNMPMEALKNEKYISLEEVADYLGIRPVILLSWVRDPKNEIPAHKIGRFRKFKCFEIEEWVNSMKSAIDK